MDRPFSRDSPNHLEHMVLWSRFHPDRLILPEEWHEDDATRAMNGRRPAYLSEAEGGKNTIPLAYKYDKETPDDAPLAILLPELTTSSGLTEGTKGASRPGFYAHLGSNVELATFFSVLQETLCRIDPNNGPYRPINPFVKERTGGLKLIWLPLVVSPSGLYRSGCMDARSPKEPAPPCPRELTFGGGGFCRIKPVIVIPSLTLTWKGNEYGTGTGHTEVLINLNVDHFHLLSVTLPGEVARRPRMMGGAARKSLTELLEDAEQLESPSGPELPQPAAKRPRLTSPPSAGGSAALQRAVAAATAPKHAAAARPPETAMRSEPPSSTRAAPARPRPQWAPAYVREAPRSLAVAASAPRATLRFRPPRAWGSSSAGAAAASGALAEAVPLPEELRLPQTQLQSALSGDEQPPELETGEPGALEGVE